MLSPVGSWSANVLNTRIAPTVSSSLAPSHAEMRATSSRESDRSEYQHQSGTTSLLRCWKPNLARQRVSLAPSFMPALRAEKRMLRSWTPKFIFSLPGLDIEFASKRNRATSDALMPFIASSWPILSTKFFRNVKPSAERGEDSGLPFSTPIFSDSGSVRFTLVSLGSEDSSAALTFCTYAVIHFRPSFSISCGSENS